MLLNIYQFLGSRRILPLRLTMQNTIGWCVKRWQQTANNDDDGWSTARMFVMFPEKKKVLDTEQREA